MNTNIKSLNKLVNVLSKLPGLGYKSSIRVAQHIIEKDNIYTNELLEIIREAKNKISKCKICYSYTDNTHLCDICDDVYRDKNTICVVEKPFDVFIFEKSGYHGLYHVLGGLLSPIDGVGEEDINVNALINRIKNSEAKELIIALSQSVEGDATTQLIAYELRNYNIKITKIARGIPVGASLDLVDETTLNSAFIGRLNVNL